MAAASPCSGTDIPQSGLTCVVPLNYLVVYVDNLWNYEVDTLTHAQCCRGTFNSELYRKCLLVLEFIEYSV